MSLLLYLQIYDIDRGNCRFLSYIKSTQTLHAMLWLNGKYIKSPNDTILIDKHASLPQLLIGICHMIKDNYIYWNNHIVYYILEILLMQILSHKCIANIFWYNSWDYY